MTSAKQEQFKNCLAIALTSCGPVKRKLIKKKLWKNKISFVELESFMRTYAPVEYGELYK